MISIPVLATTRAGWIGGLSELKRHLRVSHQSDDVEIKRLAEVARSWIEERAGVTLTTAQWTVKLPCFPGGSESLDLPNPPLVSVDSLVYYDVDNAAQALDPAVDLLVIPRGRYPGDVVPIPDTTWPSVKDRPDAITVTYTAGYGDTAADVPSAARHIVNLLVGHWYEHREAAATGAATKQVDLAVESLLISLKKGFYV